MLSWWWTGGIRRGAAGRQLVASLSDQGASHMLGTAAGGFRVQHQHAKAPLVSHVRRPPPRAVCMPSETYQSSNPLPSACVCRTAGSLSKQEVWQALQHAGFRLDLPAFESLFKSFDPDRCAVHAAPCNLYAVSCACVCECGRVGGWVSGGVWAHLAGEGKFGFYLQKPPLQWLQPNCSHRVRCG